MRPKAAISESRSKLSPGRAARKRSSPARSGDCTRVLNRVSRSDGVSVLDTAPAASMYRRVSHFATVPPSSAARRALVVLRLELLDEPLHLDGIALPVPPAVDGTLAARRLDEHIREQELGVDAHRRDVRDVD